MNRAKGFYRYLTMALTERSLLATTTATSLRTAKKAIGLDWQNSNFAGASRLSVHFFAVTARLRGENA